MHRADRNLKHAFAFDRTEFVPRAGERRKPGVRVEIFAQWINLRPVIMERATARVWVADQFDPEQVLDFPFLPVGGWDSIGKRRQLRLAGGQGYAHQHKGVRRVERIEVVNEKDIVPTARVFGKYACQ